MFTASDGASYDRFGWSVSISEDILLVGSPGKYGYRGEVPVHLYLQERDCGMKE